MISWLKTNDSEIVDDWCVFFCWGWWKMAGNQQRQWKTVVSFSILLLWDPSWLTAAQTQPLSPSNASVRTWLQGSTWRRGCRVDHTPDIFKIRESLRLDVLIAALCVLISIIRVPIDQVGPPSIITNGILQGFWTVLTWGFEPSCFESYKGFDRFLWSLNASHWIPRMMPRLPLLVSVLFYQGYSLPGPREREWFCFVQNKEFQHENLQVSRFRGTKSQMTQQVYAIGPLGTKRPSCLTWHYSNSSKWFKQMEMTLLLSGCSILKESMNVVCQKKNEPLVQG